MPQTSSLAKFPLVLNIGITGHRPERLQAAEPELLSAQISTILQQISDSITKLAATTEAQAFYSETKPVLRMLSSLAEGADRIVANCALMAGFELQCPLPFEREFYTNTFSDSATTDTYYNLLECADRIFELDSDLTKDRLAYRQAGRFVFRHADIMLAVWGGVEDEISVGADGMVAEIKKQGLPLIWINAVAPHEVKYWDRQDEGDKWSELDTKYLNDLLKTMLIPREPEEQEKQWYDCLKKCCPEIRKNTYQDFYNQKEPKRNSIGLAYRAFFTLCGKNDLSFFGKSYRADAEERWSVIADAATKHLPMSAIAGNALQNQIYENYSRADSLASYYADHYRGTFILTFFLSACAVLFAALGVLLPEIPVFLLVELVIIGFMIFLFAYSHVRQTHQHWIDFRLLAERLRQLAVMLPIGFTSQWSLPEYESYDDKSHIWINLFMRSVNRVEGIPQAYLNTDYRKAYCDYLIEVLKDQVDYHENKVAKRNRNVVTSLEKGKVLLLLVVFACIAHIVDHWYFHNKIIAFWSTLFVIVLPAFGASFAGILSQGEFERIEHRSEGMAKNLQTVVSKFKKKSHSLSGQELNQLVIDAVDIMSRELSDWRVIFRNKTLKPEA